MVDSIEQNCQKHRGDRSRLGASQVSKDDGLKSHLGKLSRSKSVKHG